MRRGGGSGGGNQILVGEIEALTEVDEPDESERFSFGLQETLGEGKGRIIHSSR